MKYYEMEVVIRGTILVPVDEYDDKDTAIECIEMGEVDEVSYKIREYNDKPYFIAVNKNRVKEVEY